MNRLILLTLTLTFHSLSFAQDYDLIVFKNGDSIACKIDSLTNSHVYFEMKAEGRWIHTHSELNEISEYKHNVIFKKQVEFKRGTTLILPADQLPPDKPTIREIRRNSIYAEFGGIGLYWTPVNYDRIIPVAEHIAFVPRVGFGEYDGEFFPVFELNFIAGGKHSFETGAGMPIFSGEDEESGDFMIRAGYRYHGRKGFLFRAAPQYYRQVHDNNTFWFALSVGYCF